MLEVKLLGRFDVRCNGLSIAITSRPAQSLFAYLILSAGTAHRREKLAGMLWPDSLEETARDNLRHALWRIRKALPLKPKTDYLLADDLSIAFNASAEYWLDAAELEKLSETASADELIAVLSTYQGELLPGFYDEWVGLEREHLYSVFEHHMARLMSLLQDEKRWLDILDWGERWIKLGQKPEPAYRALMRAHAAKGDMSKVAATYERCVKSLREFGIGPSEQTRALYERLKAGKENLETGPASPVPLGEKRKESPKTNLPVPLTSFIGREREIEEVKHLLSTTRLLTLTGSGGIGKTRLAIRAAKDLIRSYKDGVWWVELAPLIDETLVPQAVARVLGVREFPGQPLTESVKNFLREKQLLLVLDNCEHLIAACAQLAHDLLTHCADLRILTTSREALGMMGETTFHVPALSFPVLAHLSQIQNLKEFESIQLFVERAAAVRPDLALTQQNAFTVTQICHRLDGIPLAVELAAARSKILSLKEIAARLDDRFNLLTQGSRTAMPRHQTLRATIDWSYDLLSQKERVLFRRLAVFAGGWTLEEAETICSGDDLKVNEMLDLLTQLVDKSLVIVQDWGGDVRYQMLETIRQYAWEKLAEGGETESLRGRHASFFMQLAELAGPELRRPNQRLWFERLDMEIGNFRSALSWSLENNVEAGALLAGNLLWFWHTRCYSSEGRSWCARLLTTGIPPQGRQSLSASANAQLLCDAGRLAVDDMETDQVLTLSEQSLALYRELGDQGGIAMSLSNLSWAAYYLGDHSRANLLAEESLALYRELGLKLGIAEVLNLLGNIAQAQANYESAVEFYKESLAWSREVGDVSGIAHLLSAWGYLAWHQGDLERAATLTEESLTLAREIQQEWSIAESFFTLGDIARAQGDYGQASTFYDAAGAIWERVGNKREIGALRRSQALLARVQGNYQQASRLFGQALILCQEARNKGKIAECLEGLAGVAVALGKAERSARLFGATEMIREVIESPLPPVERASYGSDIASLRTQLDETTFDAVWAEGRAMSLEQAIEFALEET
jgi:predicted ATPase/DNA-binding SARP family transcriptional activator